MNLDTKEIQRSLIIPATLAHQRLDQALAKLMPDYSRTQIKEWIESGNVFVNGQVIKPKTKVKAGDLVLLHAQLKKQPNWVAQPIPLNIVFEDDDLIIISKPIGLVVHPGAGNTDHTLLNALLYYAPYLKDLPRAGILHRLDKNTSGLLIVAKKAAALKNLTMQLKKKSLLREYQAIVYGKLISGGTIAAPIGRNALKRKQMAVTETGKPAVTHFRIAEKYRAHTRLIIQLETGRTHQIRVHMASVHHPILGDTTYGGRVKLAKHMSSDLIQAIRQFKHQALHAYAIGLTHPITQKWLRFEIDLPADMQHLIRLLREDERANRTA